MLNLSPASGIIRIVLISILAVSFLRYSFAQLANKEKFVYNIKKVEKGPPLKGDLSDTLWQSALPVVLSYEISPQENTPARQRTVARLFYDSDKLYIGFECYDSSMSELRAQISDRDKIFDDDFVILFLSPYSDGQSAYEFAVNPFGIQGDILNTNNNEDPNFDAVWESAASIHPDRWCVEMAIPFKSLNFSADQQEGWRLILARVHPRDSRRRYQRSSF